MLLATFNVDILYLNNHYECNKLSNECLFIYNLDTVIWLISQKKKHIKICKEPGHVDCRIRYVNHSLWAIYCGTRPIEREMIPLPPFWQDEAKGLVGLASQRSLKSRL